MRPSNSNLLSNDRYGLAFGNQNFPGDSVGYGAVQIGILKSSSGYAYCSKDSVHNRDVKPEIKKRTLTRLCCEANTLHNEALEIKEKVLAGAMSALEKAWQCGKRLNAIKEIVGHGNWLPYLETHLPEISESTAQRYMKIDRDNPNAARVRELKFDSIRKHCLSLAPAKKQIEHPGNGGAGVPDGGSTVSLLGFALFGLVALRRKLGC